MATDGAWIKVNVFLSQVPKKRTGNKVFKVIIPTKCVLKPEPPQAISR